MLDSHRRFAVGALAAQRLSREHPDALGLGHTFGNATG